MIKRLRRVLTLVLTLSIGISTLFLLNMGTETRALELTCDDIVGTNKGMVEFKEIYPELSRFNVNTHSDKIDAEKTIDNKVMVLSATSSDTVFTFKTHLNRDYLTKYFNIVEWFIVPTKIQLYDNNHFADTDFESFVITVTDVNNRNKYVVFRTDNRPDSDTFCETVAGRAGANGQSINGVHNSDPNSVNTMWGTPLKASHVGCFPVQSVPSGYDSSLPLAGFFSLDYETKKVYSVTGNNYGERRLVRDLDEGNHLIGTDTPWNGFDSKELEVSISFKNIVSGRTASVAILGFNGMDFIKGDVVDDVCPDVIESTVFSENNLYGEKNRAMPLPEYYSYDKIDGFNYNVSYNVYYNYLEVTQQELVVSPDKTFYPVKAGTYSIIVSATDRAGNVGTFKRDVEIRNVINNLQIYLDGSISESCKVGESIDLPKAYVYGGTVNKGYEIFVLYDESTVEVSNGYFVPEKQGLYTVRYAAFDFYNEPEYFDYFVFASIDEKPIAVFPFMPDIVPMGSKIVIPEFSAKDYASFGYGVDADIKFEIKEPDSSSFTETSREFSPNKEGEYVLKITASAILDSTKYVERLYNFTSRKCDYVRDYFITDNVNIDNVNNQIKFTANASDCGFRFINSIIADGLVLNYSVIDQNGFTPVIVIKLSDSQERDNNISILIEKNKTNESTLKTCDGSCSVSGAVGSNKAYAFKLSYRNGWIYDGDSAVIKINSYDNGKVFDGFSSGRFNIEIGFSGASDSTELTFTEFCGNRDFSYNAKDIIAPVIMTSDFSRACKIGDVIGFTYSSSDLFDAECDVSVSVEYDGKTIVTGSNGTCRFAVRDFGRYQISLRSSDKSGNTTKVNYNVYCYDNIAPTLTVKDKVENELKLGKTLTLPTATVSDNVDSDLKYSVYARRPSGSYVVIEDNTFNPDVEGDWVLYYYTVDSCGNYATTAYKVHVGK